MPQTEARQTLHLHPGAPAKPVSGQVCNGCGVCCAAQPCPLGMWLSRRTHGACRALGWSAEHERYLCGAVAEPARWLPGLPARWASAIVRRWIAAGTACDSSLQLAPPCDQQGRARPDV